VARLSGDVARLRNENQRLRAAAIQRAQVPPYLDLRDLFAELRAPRDLNTTRARAAAEAVTIFGLTERFARQVLSGNLSSREQRAIIGKLEAAHSAMQRPGRPTLSDDDLRQEVPLLRNCYEQFRRIVDYAGGERKTALGDLKAAYRANFRSIVPGGGPPASPIDTEALRRVRDMAPALLTRPLHPTTLLFLRKTQRLTEPGFIGQVLAQRFGGTPASYRRRLRQLDAPDAPRLA